MHSKRTKKYLIFPLYDCTVISKPIPSSDKYLVCFSVFPLTSSAASNLFYAYPGHATDSKFLAVRCWKWGMCILLLLDTTK